jgi:hypothetical protein
MTGYFMNNELERCGRKWLWPNLRYYHKHLSGGTEENNENPQSGYAGSEPRFLCSFTDHCNTKKQHQYGTVLRYKLFSFIFH